MLQKMVAAIAGVLVLWSGPAYASDRDRDHQILRDAAQRVLRYPRFTIFDDVSASVEDGVVTLSGKVTMPYKRREIEARVASVAGVRKVVNQIDVLSVSQFDDELRYKVARAIYGHPSFWHYAALANPPIHIVVDRGRVTLTGVVLSDVERMLAKSLATSLGALSVHSELRTEAEARAEDSLLYRVMDDRVIGRSDG
jgi:hyperosmotically inducible protein